MRWSRKTGQQKLNFELQSHEKTRRQFSSAFKAEVAMEAIKGVINISEIAHECEIYPAQVIT